jgi:transposase
VALSAHRRGESDLICRDGMWFLYATCDVPDVATKEPDGFLGVDLGIANIATTSDTKRLLKARRRKEARFAADTNHTIAKRIVTEAERTGHVAKANRPDQSTFLCRSCGFAEHADRDAARNIASRGVTGWAAVSLPNAA